MANKATTEKSLLQNVGGRKSAFKQVWLGRFVIKWTGDTECQFQVSSFLKARIITLYDISAMIITYLARIKTVCKHLINCQIVTIWR